MKAQRLVGMSLAHAGAEKSIRNAVCNEKLMAWHNKRLHFRPGYLAASNKRPNKKIERPEIKNIKCINDAQPDPIPLESPDG